MSLEGSFDNEPEVMEPKDKQEEPKHVHINAKPVTMAVSANTTTSKFPKIKRIPTQMKSILKNQDSSRNTTPN